MKTQTFMLHTVLLVFIFQIPSVYGQNSDQGWQFYLGVLSSSTNVRMEKEFKDFNCENEGDICAEGFVWEYGFESGDEPYENTIGPAIGLMGPPNYLIGTYLGYQFFFDLVNFKKKPNYVQLYDLYIEYTGVGGSLVLFLNIPFSKNAQMKIGFGPYVSYGTFKGKIRDGLTKKTGSVVTYYPEYSGIHYNDVQPRIKEVDESGFGDENMSGIWEFVLYNRFHIWTEWRRPYFKGIKFADVAFYKIQKVGIIFTF